MLLLALAAPALPGSAFAQHGYELGVQGMATIADFNFAGAGAWLGWRPGGSTRLGLSLVSGVVDGDLAGRIEAVGHFLVAPGGSRTTLYAGGGVSQLLGSHDQAWLLLVLGVEGRPGLGSGWFLETGFGGGVRVVGGYRWRRLRH